MQSEGRTATIGIELTHPDIGIQELFFEQFLEFKNILHNYVDEEWTWELHHRNEEGKIISRIYTELKGFTLFNKNHWPDLISFFKPRIIALDEFWNDIKDAFEALK